MNRIHRDMTIRDLALVVSTTLRQAGIECVLTGGAVVSIYTENRYQSFDLDFISHADHERIRNALAVIGFREEGRHFSHPDTDFYVEFPPPPLAIGNQPVRELNEIQEGDRVLRLLTPTQCVMDRLAAFYFWNDRQALEQALLVGRQHDLTLEDVREWSIEEGMLDQYEQFLERLNGSS